MPRRLTHDEATARLTSRANVRDISPYPGAGKPWLMKCADCGEAISPTLHSIQKGSGPCKYCAGNIQLTHAEALDRLTSRANVRDISPYPGVGKPWSMQCGDCGEAISPALHNIQKGCGACKYCANRITHDEAVARLTNLVNVSNMSPYPGTGEPWPMECGDCGKRIKPRLNTVQRGHGACKHCALMGGYNWTTLGRDPDLRWKSSHLYVRQIVDAGRTLYKVGVGTVGRSRRGGGDVIDIAAMPLAVAFVFEQRILNEAGRVDLIEPLADGGSTEVVSDLEAVRIGFTQAQSWAVNCRTVEGRAQFDAEHFAGYLPIGRELRCAQLSLFDAA